MQEKTIAIESLPGHVEAVAFRKVELGEYYYSYEGVYRAHKSGFSALVVKPEDGYGFTPNSSGDSWGIDGVIPSTDVVAKFEGITSELVKSTVLAKIKEITTTIDLSAVASHIEVRVHEPGLNGGWIGPATIEFIGRVQPLPLDDALV